MKCFDYTAGYDTGFNPIVKRQCYCDQSAICFEHQDNLNPHKHQVSFVDFELLEKVTKMIEQESY